MSDCSQLEKAPNKEDMDKITTYFEMLAEVKKTLGASTWPRLQRSGSLVVL